MARYRDFDGEWHDVDLPPEVDIVPNRGPDQSKGEAVLLLIGILVIFLLLGLTQPPY